MSSTAGLDRVVVINDDAVESGGAAAMALASARLLRQRHIPVTYLSGEPAGTPDLEREGIEVAVLGGRHLLDGSRVRAAVRGLYDGATFAALAKWIGEHDTPGTVYHLHNWHKALSTSVFRALRPVADRLVISAHDYFLACPNGGYFNYPRQSPCELRPGSPRCIATACDRRHYGHKLWRVARHRLRQSWLDLGASGPVVLPVHEAVARHFIDAGIARENIRVLRNAAMPWRNVRVAAERNRDVFFVGRLEQDKGVDLLATAARQAGVRAQFIGQGALASRLASEHPELQLHGWLSRKQISERIGEARMLVLPSRCRETFGLVVLEALLSGVPVVISRFAAIADEVRGLGFGCVCDPYDQPGLAALLSELAADDRRIEAMSRRAFAGARALAPTPAEWCDGLLQIYGDLVRGQKVRGRDPEAGLALALAAPQPIGLKGLR